MLKQDRKAIGEFFENVIVHIFKHYGKTVQININWRKKVGSIGYDGADIGGRQLVNSFEWGLQFRKTIHKAVPQLQGRTPNGYEGLYWYALNTAGSIMAVADGKYGKVRVDVKAVAAEIHRLSIRFPFDEMMKLYWDAATAVPVKTVIDIPKNNYPDWSIGEWEAVQVYLQGIVEHLVDRFYLHDAGSHKFAIEFKNVDQAKHARWHEGIAHYILFGKKRINRYFYQGDPEYARVMPHFKDFFNGKTRRGIEALYWIACHEFAHALQTDREEIEGIEYSLGGKRIIHGRIFREELRRVVDAFTFKDSLNVITSETETEIRNLLK